MKTHLIFNLSRVAGALVLSVLLASGCKKKEAVEQPQPAAAEPAAAAPAQAEAPKADVAPPVDTTQVDALLAQARADAAARDYEKAAAALLAVQQQQQKGPLNEAQAMAAHQAMGDLQKQLAQAIAAGDPKAKAAGDALRAAAARR